VIWELALVAATYLLGSIPSALLVVWLLAGKDVRKEGSGNVGATNAARVAGPIAGVVVTVLDVAKGAGPVWLIIILNPADAWIGATMLAAVVGHCFPVWLLFRGGKGVATGFGALLVLSPLTALASAGVWLLVLAVWRRVSLASLVAAAVLPVLLVLIDAPTPVLLGLVSISAILIILRHHRNIRMLVAGDEPKIGGSDGGNE
jgi:glycerol-3-phosphate acyltransferase PlsY